MSKKNFSEENYKKELKKSLYLTNSIFTLPLIFLILATFACFSLKDVVATILVTFFTIFWSIMVYFSWKKVHSQYKNEITAKHFDDFKICNKDAYYDLLKNCTDRVTYYVDYREHYTRSWNKRFYIMNEENFLLFKIINHKIYSPFNEYMGFINYKAIGCKIYLKDFFKFKSHRTNLGFFGNFKVSTLNLICNLKNEKIYHNKKIYSEIKDTDDFKYQILFKTKEYRLEQILLFLSSIEYDTRTRENTKN